MCEPRLSVVCVCSQENCLNSEVVEQIYKRNPILRYSHHPLHSPLLPLPYGDIHTCCEELTTLLCTLQ